MKNPNSWFKPYILNEHNIEKVVNAQSAGVYVLGDMDAERKFHVRHIRSSNNVKDQLYLNVGKFQVFMYRPVKYLQHMFEEKQPSLFATH